MNITRRYMKPYTMRCVVYGLLVVLSVVFTMATALSVADFLKILFGEGGLGDVSIPTGNLISQGLQSLYIWLIGFGTTKALLYFSLIVLVLYGLKNLFSYLANVEISIIRALVVRDVRNNLFSKAIRLPLSYYDKHRQGDILSRFSNDVVEYDESILHSISALAMAAISIVLYLGMLLYINAKLTLVVLGALPIVAFVISGISRSLKRKSKDVQERQAFLMSLIQETIEGLKVVKAYTAIDFCNDRFQAYNREYNRRRTRMFRKIYLASPVSDTLGNIVVILVLLFGANLVFHHDAGLTPELFISFIMMFVLIIPHAKELANAVSTIKKGRACEDRLEELLKEDDAPVYSGATDQLPSIGDVVFEDVSFEYDSDVPVLRHLSFTIPQGKTVALVGSSGSGKSTVADLLARFYYPTSGDIRISGKSISSLDPKSYFSRLGIVGQETLLFNDSVTRNIAFMQQPDMEKVIAAAKTANAHDFICQLEQGYDTNLGDGGSLLSGGQRQRICIARALYNNPDLLILDEATSALDTENEHLVQQALQSAIQNRTTLAIAHRLTTVMDADNIIVLENGEIVEQGTHQQLMDKGGRYKQLVELQSLAN